jgi:hypothetical protein
VMANMTGRAQTASVGIKSSMGSAQRKTAF